MKNPLFCDLPYFSATQWFPVFQWFLSTNGERNLRNPESTYYNRIHPCNLWSNTLYCHPGFRIRACFTTTCRVTTSMAGPKGGFMVAAGGDQHLDPASRRRMCRSTVHQDLRQQDDDENQQGRQPADTNKRQGGKCPADHGFNPLTQRSPAASVCMIPDRRDSPAP